MSDEKKKRVLFISGTLGKAAAKLTRAAPGAPGVEELTRSNAPDLTSYLDARNIVQLEDAAPLLIRWRSSQFFAFVRTPDGREFYITLDWVSGNEAQPVGQWTYTIHISKNQIDGPGWVPIESGPTGTPDDARAMEIVESKIDARAVAP